MYIGYAKNLSVTQRIFADVVNVDRDWYMYVI